MREADRSIREHHLARAERRVIEAEQNLARQRAILSRLKQDEHDTARAADLLNQYEKMLQWLIADRDRLRKDLGVRA